METKQTAVDWLFAQIFKDINTEFVARLKAKSKAMEKDQIAEAFNNSYWFIDGIEYYEKTYGK